MTPGSVEIHGTGARLDGPAALALIEAVRDRTAGLGLPWFPTVPAALKPFGRALAQSNRHKESLKASLPPGGLNETEVPLGSLFDLKAGRRFTVRAFCEPASCEPNGTVLESNEIVIG